MPPQIITLWHKDYFELNATEKKLIPKNKQTKKQLSALLGLKTGNKFVKVSTLACLLKRTEVNYQKQL